MAVLTVADDESTLATAAAGRVTGLLGDAITSRGSATFCLTGGRTPRSLYTLLGDPGGAWQHRIDWANLHLFWGDERHVPPDHPDSNFGMVHELLIQHVPVPMSQVHRMRGELPDPAAAALEYEGAIRQGFARAHRSDPTFDVMLLGMGDDGHIASIFPSSPVLTGWRRDESEAQGLTDENAEGHSMPGRRVVAVNGPDSKGWRITLTPPALLDAHVILVLVAGASKANAVLAALKLREDVERWPAQLLRAAGDRVEWLMDRDAAAAL